MSLAAFRDAIDLLTTRPALWLPGIACGLLAALVSIIFYIGGIFFVGRLFIFVLLATIFFVTCSFLAIRDSDRRAKDLLKESGSYYFRVLIPTLVILSGMVLVFALVILTLALIGIQPYSGLLIFLIFGVVFPTLMLTFFYDTAAVFEDKKVFESLQRSIEVVTANLFEVMLFYIGCFILFCTVAFAFFVAWTAVLADRLEPIAHYNETQIIALTPDQFTGLIGQDGVWVTAACIFGMITILFPLLCTYKACFFRIISGTTIPIRQTIGEYDNKGRYYKY